MEINKYTIFAGIIALTTLSGCEYEDKIIKMDDNRIKKELNCKQCESVKLEVPTNIQQCFMNEKIKLPVYIKSSANDSIFIITNKTIFAMGFLNLPVKKEVAGSYPGYVKAYYNSNTFSDFESSWRDIRDYNQAHFDYQKGSYVFFAPKEFFEKNKQSSVKKELFNLLSEYCYTAENYIDTYNDNVSWIKNE